MATGLAFRMSSSTPANFRPPFPFARLLRVSGVLLALGTVGWWAAKGAHRGWSQHRVPVKHVDEVTGLDYVTYEDRYVPGVEVLAGGLGAGAALAVLSLFFRRKKSTIQP